MQVIAGFESPAVSVQSLIFRQQRRVNIEHSAFIAAHKIGSEDSHKARENDQVRLVVVDGAHQSDVKLFSGSEATVIDDTHVQIAVAGFLHTRGLWFVTNHASDFCIDCATQHLIGNGQHIAATA